MMRFSAARDFDVRRKLLIHRLREVGENRRRAGLSRFASGPARAALRNSLLPVTSLEPYGDVPEWLWSGLQNRLPRFNSGRRLQA